MPEIICTSIAVCCNEDQPGNTHAKLVVGQFAQKTTFIRQKCAIFTQISAPISLSVFVFQDLL